MAIGTTSNMVCDRRGDPIHGLSYTLIQIPSFSAVVFSVDALAVSLDPSCARFNCTRRGWGALKQTSLDRNNSFASTCTKYNPVTLSGTHVRHHLHSTANYLGVPSCRDMPAGCIFARRSQGPQTPTDQCRQNQSCPMTCHPSAPTTPPPHEHTATLPCACDTFLMDTRRMHGCKSPASQAIETEN